MVDVVLMSPGRPPRSYQDGHRLLTVRNFIVLPHWAPNLGLEDVILSSDYTALIESVDAAGHALKVFRYPPIWYIKDSPVPHSMGEEQPYIKRSQL